MPKSEANPPIDVDALLAENANLHAQCDALLGEVDGLKSQAALWQGRAESAFKMLEEHVCEPAAALIVHGSAPITTGTRDGHCTIAGRHVAGCVCTGGMRDPM